MASKVIAELEAQRKKDNNQLFSELEQMETSGKSKAAPVPKKKGLTPARQIVLYRQVMRRLRDEPEDDAP